MFFNAVVRWRHRRFGFNPPRPMLRPTVRTGLMISWSGMRGIVSLAAALALPTAFPYRNLILLTAFAVVLGTLLIQGLTLKPLLRALDLRDDDPVGRELRAARERALGAGLESLPNDQSPIAKAVRHEFTAHLTDAEAAANAETPPLLPQPTASWRGGGGATGCSGDARQRRDRRRCLPSDRRGTGLAGNGRGKGRARRVLARIALHVRPATTRVGCEPRSAAT